MKTPSSRRAHGFTLVELLVVIAIIAVLAAAGFAAGNAAIQNAKKTTCLASAMAIETAVNHFFTEYNSMPKEGTSVTTVKTDTDTSLLKELLGDKAAVLNTRQVKFLSVREGKKKGTGGTNGLIYDDANAPTGLFDPWGGPYFVRLDLEYKEQIDIPSNVKNGGIILNGRRVAVWSLGADGVKGSGGSKNDDVVTWGQ